MMRVFMRFEFMWIRVYVCLGLINPQWNLLSKCNLVLPTPNVINALQFLRTGMRIDTIYSMAWLECVHLRTLCRKRVRIFVHQNPSWEDNIRSMGQEIPCLLWNPMIPHCLKLLHHSICNYAVTTNTLHSNLTLCSPCILTLIFSFF
jgi:hypothetical protein